MKFRQVIKVGGSLLGSDHLHERLLHWTDQARVASDGPLEQLVIVGGGASVDAIRHRDREQPGDPVEVHWLCVNLLAATFLELRRQFPNWDSVTTTEELDAGISGGFRTDTATLVSVDSFYCRDTVCSLPMDWRTTSDAIAAYLAIIADAHELVLLKSCVIPPGASIQQLNHAGIVDDAIVSLSPQIGRIRLLRL